MTTSAVIFLHSPDRKSVKNESDGRNSLKKPYTHNSNVIRIQVSMAVKREQQNLNPKVFFNKFYGNLSHNLPDPGYFAFGRLIIRKFLQSKY